VACAIFLSPAVDALNPAILDVQYAVRGELAIKAEEYRVRLKAGANDLPFDKVTSTNIGNPQQAGLDQPPITFNRQVAALMEWPALAELARDVFPEDVIARAKELQSEIGSIGAYSHSQGVAFIRKNVARFIEGEFSAVSSFVAVNLLSTHPPLPLPSFSLLHLHLPFSSLGG